MEELTLNFMKKHMKTEKQFRKYLKLNNKIFNADIYVKGHI